MNDSSPDTVMPDSWLPGRLPRRIAESFIEEQRTALHEAIAAPPPSKHLPVNIRLSLPFLKWRFFVTVIGGKERRSAARQARDRAQNPLGTAGNVFFVAGLVMLFYLIAFFVFAPYSAIIEFQGAEIPPPDGRPQLILRSRIASR